jgi:hypothetical protein
LDILQKERAFVFKKSFYYKIQSSFLLFIVKKGFYSKIQSSITLLIDLSQGQHWEGLSQQTTNDSPRVSDSIELSGTRESTFLPCSQITMMTLV